MKHQIIKLDDLTLKSGGHKSLNEGACVMEAVSMLAGEKWSDHPECACPVVSAFLRSWNDSLPDDDRQQLKQYIPLLLGSKSTPEMESRRAMMCVDWVIRIYTPTWLRLAKIVEEAEKLSQLPPIRSTAEIKAAQPILDKARTKAGAAAWDAAWDAARAAAWAAARAAAWDAARAAAWDAAWDAARAAAWDAARAAAWDAARAAAWAAARAAAWAAAWDAAWDTARAAAWDAAGVALKPTVDELKLSAHDLVRRMLEKQRV